MKGIPPILVVEDNENDRMLIRRTFARSGIPNPRHFVEDGETAISYLKGLGRYSDRIKYPLPALVLLDLKLPDMDGFDVLKWIRSQPPFRRLRIVVLTSYSGIRTVQKAYRLGANSFLVKPFEFQNLRALLDTVTAQLWPPEPTDILERPPRTKEENPVVV